jgi:hypothetical protein
LQLEDATALQEDGKGVVLPKSIHHRLHHRPLFPWRHSPEVLPRLDPSTRDYDEQGQLLGGGIATTHPIYDEVPTAWLFMNVPWIQLLFFKDWKDEMAHHMSWAFTQGLAGILSNVYRGVCVHIFYDVCGTDCVCVCACG